MSHNHRNQSSVTIEQVRAAVESFCDFCDQHPDQNNLGQLAQMHSCCETLQDAPDSIGNADSRAAIARLARAVATFLEKAILNETPHAAQGLEALPRAAAALSAALAQGDFAAADELENEFRQYASTAAAPISAPAQPAAKSAQPAAKPAAAAPVAQAPSSAEAVEQYVSEPLILDMDEREHLTGFVDEAREHMDAIEAALLEVERDPADPSKINELFRPIHTIKGIAGFLNLRDINRLAHEVETILDLARRAELSITPTTVDLFFAACDALKQQIASIAGYLGSPNGNPVPQPEISGLIGRLRIAAAGEAAPQETPVQRQSAPRAETGGVSTGGTASEVATTSEAARQSADTSLRIDTAKLDQLIDWVGELVIAQTMVNLNKVVHTDELLTRNVTHVAKIVREIQECAMGMRMVPIGPTFQKMKRLVRDVARKAGKEVELVISGEETELDKTVIQQISDPLVHMVRNSVDHGIEPPDERRKIGKAEQGAVYLDAYHQGDSIVIEIRDDGRGLRRNKILEKAIERGLVSPNEQLTDQQVFSLVLEAGFSTAEKITDISGRGVGMDVVRRNVEQLRGKIEIQSEEGKGTTFLIRLPLTLAIIDGMLVRVGSERLIIPTIMIDRSLRPTSDQVHNVQLRGEMLMVRGELYPIIELGPLFGYTDPVDPCNSLVVICQCEGQKIGLVVDELIGQQQVVIKTLGERFKHIRGVSGAAILGDGRVGLILEPTGLLRLHNSQHSTAVNGACAASSRSECGQNNQTENRDTSTKQVTTVG